MASRLNVTLDDEIASKLRGMAERMHVNEGTLARSLLSTAIDNAEPDGENLIKILDGIDGSWERIDRGLDEMRRGETLPLTEL